MQYVAVFASEIGIKIFKKRNNFVTKMTIDETFVAFCVIDIVTLFIVVTLCFRVCDSYLNSELEDADGPG